MYRTLHSCGDLSYKWLIANRDTAQRVQRFCAAAFLSPGSRSDKGRDDRIKICHPSEYQIQVFGRLIRINVMTTIPKPFLSHRSSFWIFVLPRNKCGTCGHTRLGRDEIRLVKVNQKLMRSMHSKFTILDSTYNLCKVKSLARVNYEVQFDLI